MDESFLEDFKPKRSRKNKKKIKSVRLKPLPFIIFILLFSSIILINLKTILNWEKDNQEIKKIETNIEEEIQIEIIEEEGEIINPPNVDEIISHQDEEGLHYYRFDGWYFDKEYTRVFNLQNMPSNKVEVYAKWVDVTVKIHINASEFNEEYLYTTYIGASLDKLYTIFDIYQDGLDIYTITSFNHQGEKLEDLVAYEDLILDPVWEKVIYKAVINQEEIELDLTSSEPLVNEGKYMILIDGVYYILDASNINPSYLYKNYLSAFDENYSIQIDSFVELDGYNYVLFDDLDSRFNNKNYIGLMMKDNTVIDNQLLPNQEYSFYEINAWIDQNDNYYSPIGINITLDDNYHLKAYVSLKNEYFNYSNSYIIGYNSNYQTETNQIKKLLLPIYDVSNQRIIGVKQLVDDQGNNSNAFNNNQVIEEILVPNGYVSIGDYAFANIKNLTNIYFADSVSSIGKYALFYDGYGSFENNRDIAQRVRIYRSSSSSLTSINLLACKWNSKEKYYGKNYKWSLTDWGVCNLTNAYQTFDGDVLKISSTILQSI